MSDVVHEKAASERRGDIADGAHDRPPKLPARQTRPAIRGIIQCRAHFARIRHHLPNRQENRECNRKLQADGAIKSRGESDAANRGKEALPRQRIVIESPRGSVQLDCQSDARRRAGLPGSVPRAT